MDPNDVAIRKRTQIAKANRVMFIWIAIASALVGAAIVVSFFMIQKLTYGEKVLTKKQETVSTLDHNLTAVNKLKEDVQALDANSALMSVKANDTDQALQVVLDALPSEANSLALGASLQNKLLAGINGNYSLESLQVTPVNGVESLTGASTTVDASSTAATSNTITFSFSVKGDQAALQQVLANLERSIRTINVTSANIQTQGGALTMSIQGVAYYQPAKTIQLTEETVPVEDTKK